MNAEPMAKLIITRDEATAVRAALTAFIETERNLPNGVNDWRWNRTLAAITARTMVDDAYATLIRATEAANNLP